jgi:hypothetical protein
MTTPHAAFLVNLIKAIARLALPAESQNQYAEASGYLDRRMSLLWSSLTVREWCLSSKMPIGCRRPTRMGSWNSIRS